MKAGAYLSTIYNYRCVCCSEPTVLTQATKQACGGPRLWLYFPFLRLKSLKSQPRTPSWTQPWALVPALQSDIPVSCTRAGFPVILHPCRAHRPGRGVSTLLLSSDLPALSPPVAWEQSGAKGFACQRQHYTCPTTTSCQFLNYTWKDISSEH